MTAQGDILCMPHEGPPLSCCRLWVMPDPTAALSREAQGWCLPCSLPCLHIPPGSTQRGPGTRVLQAGGSHPGMATAPARGRGCSRAPRAAAGPSMGFGCRWVCPAPRDGPWLCPAGLCRMAGYPQQSPAKPPGTPLPTAITGCSCFLFWVYRCWRTPEQVSCTP